MSGIGYPRCEAFSKRSGGLMPQCRKRKAKGETKFCRGHLNEHLKFMTKEKSK